MDLSSTIIDIVQKYGENGATILDIYSSLGRQDDQVNQDIETLFEQGFLIPHSVYEGRLIFYKTFSVTLEDILALFRPYEVKRSIISLMNNFPISNEEEEELFVQGIEKLVREGKIEVDIFHVYNPARGRDISVDNLVQMSEDAREGKRRRV